MNCRVLTFPFLDDSFAFTKPALQPFPSVTWFGLISPISYLSEAFIYNYRNHFGKISIYNFFHYYSKKCVTIMFTILFKIVDDVWGRAFRLYFTFALAILFCATVCFSGLFKVFAYANIKSSFSLSPPLFTFFMRRCSEILHAAQSNHNKICDPDQHIHFPQYSKGSCWTFHFDLAKPKRQFYHKSILVGCYIIFKYLTLLYKDLDHLWRPFRTPCGQNWMLIIFDNS